MKTSFHFVSTLITLICLGLLISCSSADDEPSSLTTTNIITPGNILDVGKNGDASDLFVKFSISDVQLADAVRLVIIPSSSATSTSNLDATNISASSYQQVQANRLENKIKLNSSLLDIDQNALKPNEAYDLAFIVIKGGVEQVNRSVGSFELQDQNIYLGKYVGGWEDNHFGDTRFSVVLDTEENGIKGPFYFLETFESCCGGDNDGEMKLTIEDNNRVTFRYSQELGSYRGSPCDGVYTGEGVIRNDNSGITINIDFNGSDCEGDHSNATIEMERIE